MKIDKQLFENILSGKLKGTFVLRNKLRIKTEFLTKSNFESLGFLYKLHDLDVVCAEYTGCGKASCNTGSNFDIIDFIPETDMKENELTIEIPDGKIVDWDESKKQNKIVLKDKKDKPNLSYGDICRKLFGSQQHYHITHDGHVEVADFYRCDIEPNAAKTRHQLECILAKNKLANVATYLNDGWKPNKGDHVFTITYYGSFNTALVVEEYYFGTGGNLVLFKTQKVAKQALEILGEETVKLALEPLGI